MTTIPYDDRPIAETHPQRLAEAARRWSLRPPLIESAHVLEVGCAHGVNLMALAARHPDANFVGIDVEGDAIEVAQRRAREAELRNIIFEARDLTEFEGGAREFDYVLAHGVLAWTPPSVGDALFALCARVLSPDGLAYISYDAKPGALMREAIGLGLRDASDLDGALELLGHSPALRGTYQGAWLDAELHVALERSPAFFQQQFLEPSARALAFTEVWDWAERHGLRYLDDVAPTGLPDDILEHTRRSVAAVTSDRRSAEQLFDVSIMRQLRASVFSRREAGPRVVDRPKTPVAEQPSLPQRPRVLPLTRVEARELGFVSTPSLEARGVHRLHALIIEHADGVNDHAALEDVVIEAARSGVLELPSASGAPATLEELIHGVDELIVHAVRDLAAAGIVFE